MVCKINNNRVLEEKELLYDIKYLDDIELLYMCLYRKAYGCQMHHMGVCDKGERCMDI